MEDIIFNLYQRTGEYFTGNRRKRPLFVVLILLFILLNFLSYVLKVIVDVETLYWVFSTLVQALLALVALMGVVSIFKLQNLYDQRNKLLAESQSPMFTIHLNGEYSTIEALFQAIDSYIVAKRIGKPHYMITMKNRIDDFFLSKGLVVGYAVKYTVYTFSVAITALLFLMLAPVISALYLGINSLYLIFILTSYSLFLAGKGFIYSVQD